VAFPDDKRLLPPNELLYRRALVLAPGRFDSVSGLHANLIQDTLAQLPQDEIAESKGGLGLFCLSIGDASANGQAASARRIVAQVNALQELGYGVMVFRARELYAISAYANRYTQSRIHFAIGLAVLVRVFEDRYKDLAGTVLEGVARLFTQNVRVSVYPMAERDLRKRAEEAGLTGWTWKETNGMVSADNLHPSGALDSLYQYLLAGGFILPCAERRS